MIKSKLRKFNYRQIVHWWYLVFWTQKGVFEVWTVWWRWWWVVICMLNFFFIILVLNQVFDGTWTPACWLTSYIPSLAQTNVSFKLYKWRFLSSVVIQLNAACSCGYMGTVFQALILRRGAKRGRKVGITRESDKHKILWGDGADVIFHHTVTLEFAYMAVMNDTTFHEKSRWQAWRSFSNTREGRSGNSLN